MGSREAERHALYNRLTEVLGPEHSVTIMTYLPGIPADEMLTKADLKAAFLGLDGRFQAIDARFDQVDSRFERIDARFDQVDFRFERIEDRLDRLDQTVHDHIRLFVATTVGAMTGLTAIYAFVVSLIR